MAVLPHPRCAAKYCNIGNHNNLWKSNAFHNRFLVPFTRNCNIPLPPHITTLLAHSEVYSTIKRQPLPHIQRERMRLCCMSSLRKVNKQKLLHREVGEASLVHERPRHLELTQQNQNLKWAKAGVGARYYPGQEEGLLEFPLSRPESPERKEITSVQENVVGLRARYCPVEKDDLKVSPEKISHASERRQLYQIARDTEAAIRSTYFPGQHDDLKVIPHRRPTKRELFSVATSRLYRPETDTTISERQLDRPHEALKRHEDVEQVDATQKTSNRGKKSLEPCKQQVPELEGHLRARKTSVNQKLKTNSSSPASHPEPSHCSRSAISSIAFSRRSSL